MCSVLHIPINEVECVPMTEYLERREIAFNIFFAGCMNEPVLETSRETTKRAERDWLEIKRLKNAD